MITGVENNKNGLIELCKESKEIFRDISMNLREWVTNSQEINDQIKLEDQREEKVTDVLGLAFNIYTDELSVSTKLFETREPATTKREILTILASIYDTEAAVGRCS